MDIAGPPPPIAEIYVFELRKTWPDEENFKM